MRQVNYRKPKRLFIEQLETREVPATIVVTTTADVVDPADHKVSRARPSARRMRIRPSRTRSASRLI